MEAMTAPMAANTSHSDPLAVAAMNTSMAPPQSYFAYPYHSGLMLAHIMLMTVAWFFVLPISECTEISMCSSSELTPQRCRA